nr:hypothetical protein [Tanacetum cinerariifolium]
LNPCYIRPFKILAKVGTLAYRLKLPEKLSRVHSTFHVSNLKKCFVDEPLTISLDEIQIDDKLNFIKEPVEIMNRKVKRLKQICIPIVKVKENSKKDKIESKPDKNGNRDKAGKSQKQSQSVEEEKLKKKQKEGPNMHSPTSLIRRKKNKDCFCNYIKGQVQGSILPTHESGTHKDLYCNTLMTLEGEKVLKKAQEKDKIGSKPDKYGKRGEARKSQKQLQ